MRVMMTIGLLALAACKGDDTDDTDVATMFDFTMTGAGYDPHGPTGIHIALTDDAGAIVDTRDVAITDGAWTYTATDALLGGATYSVSWYADMSEVTGCQAFAEDGTTVLDHVWKKPIAAVTADVTMDHTHGTDFDPSGCAAFE